MKKRRRHYKSTLRRVEMIREITAKHYEQGNHLRSYKAVWRKWVNPVYPMTYDTYLRLLQISPEEAGETVTTIEGRKWKQLTIFDVL